VNGCPWKFRLGDQNTKLTTWLEKAVEMNPQFAPAYSALASLYSTRPETRDKAIATCRKAAELEPGNLAYRINYAYVLLNTGKTSDAKALAERIQQVTKTPTEKHDSAELMLAVYHAEIRDREIAALAERAKQSAEEVKAASVESASTIVVTASASPSKPETPSNPNGSGTAKKSSRTEFAVEGVISAAECNAETSGKVTLTFNRVEMKFQYSSLSTLYVVSTAKEDSGQAPACSEWKGRRARLYFYQTKDRPYAGELNTIQFF